MPETPDYPEPKNDLSARQKKVLAKAETVKRNKANPVTSFLSYARAKDLHKINHAHKVWCGKNGSRLSRSKWIIAILLGEITDFVFDFKEIKKS